MSAIDDLIATVSRLRAPDGCPWDREQTHQSLAICLVEEASELLDTIDREDFPHMREELGDVLLQVVMHAQMADESGHFSFDDVAREIDEKLIRRHPHVFGKPGEERPHLRNSEEVLTKWDEIKAAEKKNSTKPEPLFKDLPPALPALLFALEAYKRIRKKNLTTGAHVDQSAIESRATSLDEETAGKAFFELVAACRIAGIDPESACRRYARSVMTETEALNAHAV